MKKAIYIISVSLISLFILINVFSIFNISFFGYRTFKIVSGSMKPLYDVNDLIIVKSKSDYKLNDVVTYKNNQNEYVTHRIINKDKNTFTLKGDFNNVEDKEIRKEDIVGKVVYKSRVLKFINTLFTSVVFWLIVPIIFLIIMIIPKRKENDRK